MQQRFFLTAVTFLGRLVGVTWMLGGSAALLAAVLFSENRGIFIAGGAFFLVSGIGLLMAKPASSADSERMRNFVEGMKRNRR